MASLEIVSAEQNQDILEVVIDLFVYQDSYEVEVNVYGDGSSVDSETKTGYLGTIGFDQLTFNLDISQIESNDAYTVTANLVSPDLDTQQVQVELYAIEITSYTVDVPEHNVADVVTEFRNNTVYDFDFVYSYTVMETSDSDSDSLTINSGQTFDINKRFLFDVPTGESDDFEICTQLHSISRRFFE